jgi:hypothetical protein
MNFMTPDMARDSFIMARRGLSRSENAVRREISPDLDSLSDVQFPLELLLPATL